MNLQVISRVIFLLFLAQLITAFSSLQGRGRGGECCLREGDRRKDWMQIPKIPGTARNRDKTRNIRS